MQRGWYQPEFFILPFAFLNAGLIGLCYHAQQFPQFSKTGHDSDLMGVFFKFPEVCSA